MTNHCFWIFLTLAACGGSDAVVPMDAPIDAPTCATRLHGEIHGPPATTQQSADVVVRGSLAPEAGLTVYHVYVAGIPATSDGFDFTAWSATVPFALLESLASANTASVPVSVASNCGPDATIGTAIVLIAEPDAQVMVKPQYVQAKYLPATVASSLDVIISADVTGSATSLTASTGTLTSASLVLPITAKFVPELKVGQSAIIANVNGQLGSTLVQMLGPPVLVPAGAALPVGESLTVTLIGGNAISRCTATNSNELDVTYLGASIVGKSAAAGTTADGSVQLIVRAMAKLPPSTPIEITCFDVYEQPVKAIFTVAN